MAQAIDPVCNMTVDTETAKHTSQYQGNTYYFCAPGCKAAFEKDPTQYVGTQQTDGGDHAGHASNGGNTH